MQIKKIINKTTNKKNKYYKMSFDDSLFDNHIDNFNLSSLEDEDRVFSQMNQEESSSLDPNQNLSNLSLKYSLNVLDHLDQNNRVMSTKENQEKEQNQKQIKDYEQFNEQPTCLNQEGENNNKLTIEGIKGCVEIFTNKDIQEPKNSNPSDSKAKTKPKTRSTNVQSKTETFEEKNEENLLNKKRKNENSNENENSGLPKQGRRKKDSEKEDGHHDKFALDNLTSKIKTSAFSSFNGIFNSLLCLTIKKFKPNKDGFLSIPKKTYIEDLKRESNLALMDKTLEEIFMVENTSKSAKTNPNHNIELVRSIMNQTEESDLKKILRLTFREGLILLRDFTGYRDEEMKETIFGKINENILRIFKVNGFESYIEENLEKFRSETKTQEELERYLEALREQCKNYENWFKNKQQRKTTERRKKNEEMKLDEENEEDMI